MSDATIQLLTSSVFFLSIAIGSIGVIGVMIWTVFARRPSPIGGLALTTGIAIAFAVMGELPSGLAIGLVLLGLAGLVPVRSPIGTMAMLVPGAVVVALSLSPQTGLVGFVVASIVLLAPLAASFDDRHASSTLATPLLAMSFVTVFLTVPDTNVAVLAAGAAAPWLVAGPPAKLARLGRPGVFAAVGILIWLVASGGFSRTLSLIAGIATLGVIVIEPVVAEMRARTRSAEGGEGALRQTGTAGLIAAHAAILAAISIVIRI